MKHRDLELSLAAFIVACLLACLFMDAFDRIDATKRSRKAFDEHAKRLDEMIDGRAKP